MENIKTNKGFSLVELLVVLAVSLIAMTAVYTVFESHQRAYHNQQRLVEMHQNVRSGLLYLENEIQMAGFDPTGDAGAGLVTAGADNITFTYLADSDGKNNDGDADIDEPGEIKTVSFTLNGGDLRTSFNAFTGAVAENFEVLNFVYLNQNGNVTADLTDIRRIAVAVVARTAKGEKNYVNTRSYANLRGEEILPAQNDRFRRVCLATEVICRNLGL